MSDTSAIMMTILAAMFGAGFIGQLLAEALIRFAVWKGWLPRLTFVMRFDKLTVEASPAPSRQKEDA